MAQNSSITYDIISTALCKCQQNVLTTEIKIKLPIKSNVLENKNVLKTVNSHNGTLHISQTTHNKL